MANERLIKVLEEYTGDAEALDAFVSVAVEELGADWVSTIYDVMADAPADIQEKLAHAFNYNAATTAWNELQAYLLQETPLDYQETMERVPILEHWLGFFGAVGTEAVAQLKEKLRSQGEATHQDTAPLTDPFATPVSVSETPASSATAFEDSSSSDIMPAQTTAELPEEIENIFADTPVEPQSMQQVSQYLDSRHQEPDVVPSVEPILEEAPIVSIAQETLPPVDTYRTDVFDPIAVEGPAQNETPLQAESEESWRVRKMFRQIDFIANIESWISFLCLDLGYTDFYTYRYYGFLVDVLDKTIEELKELLSQTDLYDIMNRQKAGGVQFLQNKLVAYQKQAGEAHEMLSDYIPLVREDLSVDDLKKRLGGMDLSEEKEYLGPAPDGFEMIDDPYENMNEDDLKKEYEKIEAEGNLAADNQEGGLSVPPPQMSQEKPITDVKNTSQTPQNGVQRKMSFTFGTKPAVRPTTSDETAS